MDKVFSVEILIAATAYIRAGSPEEAARIAQDNFGHPQDASVSTRTVFGDVDVSDESYDSEDLPDVSISPALTFFGSASVAFDAKDFTPNDCDEA